MFVCMCVSACFISLGCHLSPGGDVPPAQRDAVMSEGNSELEKIEQIRKIRSGCF